jgi:micrococcal nuclease
LDPTTINVLAVLAIVLWLATKRRPGRRRPKRRGEPHRESFDAATSHQVGETRTLSGNAYIVDGDTITIRKTQIRLFGIDAPELNHPYGQKAKWKLVALCKGQRVRAEILEEDDHGRTVAKCFLEDGRDLSAEMVRAGLAIDWPKFSDGAYRALEVHDARKKMWLADARQKGRMHVWEKFEKRQGKEP